MTGTEAETEAETGDPVVVRDNPGARQFEVWVGDVLAGFTEYRRRGDVYTFFHSKTDPAFGGRGLASTLVRAALDEMQARGLQVLPTCPFVRRFVARHPEYLGLVPESERSRFGLG